MNAVITAGGRVDGLFAEAIGTDIKALAPLGTKRCIDVAIDAARDAGVSEIAVVAGPAVAEHVGSRVTRTISAVEDGVENMRRAFHAWPGEDLLYLTSDLPFVDARGVRDFIARSRSFAVTIALAEAGTYERAFPGAPPHVMSLGGERFASGSAFIIRAQVLDALERLAAPFFEARKDALAMARLLGPSLMLRFLFRTLRVAAIERRAEGVLGAPVAAIRAASPGLCYDIDTLAEYEYARRRLA